MTALTKVQYQKVGVAAPNLTRYKHFFILLFIILILSIVTIIVHLIPVNYYKDNYRNYEKFTLSNIFNLPKTVIEDDALESLERDPKCNYWNCFNVYRCGRSPRHPNKIAVYVYPLRRYVNGEDVSIVSPVVSREYYEILDAVVKSPYYTPDPSEACIFIPSIDTLNQKSIDLRKTAQVLQSLPFWNDNGENHLLFNMIAGRAPLFSTVTELNTGRAMIAGAGFDTWTFRRGFDISLPVYSTLVARRRMADNVVRSWLVISSETAFNPDHMHELRIIEANHPELLILGACEVPTNRTERCRHGSDSTQRFKYPNVLEKATFCLIVRGARLGTPTLLEAMASNCIPVIVADNVVMPFAPYIDWRRAAIFILERNLNSLMEVLKTVSDQHITEMQEQVRWLYDMYFSSLKRITDTALHIIQDRMFPQTSRLYDDWNVIPNQRADNPLFLPMTASRSQGFTAVVLTYDRVESLFTLIQKLSKVPSLMKILVVWNNQKKSPPQSSLWPKINKPIKVIQTKANKLSNRFYPYDEIETEAILNIDDDIVMLTADELEFGFEVWREFPDRIVGFPSRTHRWDNVTNSWRYESEWTNDISMVLTGAAFMHKYWSYVYTTQLPADVRDWVDDHMNCEDIAMNFLVANVTNKAPIKVAPRKKFKCPECTNTEMLSADLSHMMERSQCVDRFAKAFGRMPLQAVEFRADPVLFKDPFPEKLKRFNEIGSL